MALNVTDYLTTKYNLRPLWPGQTSEDRQLPTQEVFRYVYRHIEDDECQKYLNEVKPWLAFNAEHQLYTNPTLPILDQKGKSFPDLEFDIHAILNLPANQDKFARLAASKAKSTQVLTPASVADTDSHIPGSAQAHTSGATPSGNPTSALTTVPQSNPTTADHPDLDSGDEMTNICEKAVFFPPTNFDGKDKALSRNHWQSFEDFVSRQKWDNDPTTHAKEYLQEILSYFKMTLRDLARQWSDNITVDTFDELKKEILRGI